MNGFQVGACAMEPALPSAFVFPRAPLICSDEAVIPNSAKGRELGGPEWKSSPCGTSPKDFGGCNGTEIAVGIALLCLLLQAL